MTHWSLLFCKIFIYAVFQHHKLGIYSFFLDLLKTYSSYIKSLLTLGDDTTYTSYTHDPKLTSDISHGKPAGN